MSRPIQNRMAEYIARAALCAAISRRVRLYCEYMRWRLPDNHAAIDDVELRISKALRDGNLSQARLMIEASLPGVLWDERHRERQQ